MARKTKARTPHQSAVVPAGIRIDLVRSGDGKSTADDPLTVSNVPAALEKLADRVEVDWPTIPPFVAQLAEFCAWRLRELVQGIGYPNGMAAMERDASGRWHSPAPPDSLNLLESLGKARLTIPLGHRLFEHLADFERLRTEHRRLIGAADAVEMHVRIETG